MKYQNNPATGSPKYQAPLQDVGDPLFRTPLIARHQGVRMEEILKLGPARSGPAIGTYRVHKPVWPIPNNSTDSSLVRYDHGNANAIATMICTDQDLVGNPDRLKAPLLKEMVEHPPARQRNR